MRNRNGSSRHSHFYNAIEYIQRNGEKHSLPANKGLQPLVADMVCDIDSALAPHKQLQSIPENSEKWNSVKGEIEKVDGEIDEGVYGLYGLGEEEIKIVDK